MEPTRHMMPYREIKANNSIPINKKEETKMATRAGWPSKKEGMVSGGGRDNNPPKR